MYVIVFMQQIEIFVAFVSKRVFDYLTILAISASLVASAILTGFMNPLIKIAVSLLVATKNENGAFLAKCPFLNIVTQGNTEEQALANLNEEIEFFFLSCLEAGTLVAAMNKRTQLKKDPSSPEEFLQVEPHYVSIPADIPMEILKLMTDAAVSVT